MEQLTENILFAGRYRLLEVKGRGSFGEVWRATDERLQSEVAVKVYIALDPKGLEEFVSEYKVANTLSHPNLLHADYFDVWNNRPFIVMPYCPDSSGALIGRMNEETAWRFLRDVSGGLAYLHGKGIIHRDIKPDNILRDKEGRFLISDFGISTKMRSTLCRNSTRLMDEKNDLAGTIGYMAPELFSSKPAAVNATDIWALGASLYELLTGGMPFMGQGGVMLLHGAEIPELEDNYSRDLQTMLESCMAMDTWERPTAEQLQSYAEAKLRGETPARPWKSGNVSAKEIGTEKGAENFQKPEDKSGEDASYKDMTGGKESLAEKTPMDVVPSTETGKKKKKIVWLWMLVFVVIFAGVAIFIIKPRIEEQKWQEQLAQQKMEYERKQQKQAIERKQQLQEKIAMADKIIRVGDVEFGMMYVEGGSFSMGMRYLPSSADYDISPNIHRVTLSGFYIGQCEVTLDLWMEVMGYNPIESKYVEYRGDYAVSRVSWHDCQEFIKKLNERTGMKFRLPTEAEWEYAATGGSKSKGYRYSGSDAANDVCNIDGIDDGSSYSAPVGQKLPNELGLYDMCGNVGEWCQDWYEHDYGKEDQTNPTGPTSGEERVFRGYFCVRPGGIVIYPASNRSRFEPYYKNGEIGFRLALDAY